MTVILLKTLPAGWSRMCRFWLWCGDVGGMGTTAAGIGTMPLRIG